MKIPKPLSSFHLRTIALVSMFIDHFGKVLLGDLLNASHSVTNAMRASDSLRDVVLVAVHRAQNVLWPLFDATHCIGRLAFPLYCFLLVQGFLHTRSRAKYALRLGILALVSEIPFDLAFSDTVFEPISNNVFVTLLAGLLLIWGVSALEARLSRIDKRSLRTAAMAAGTIVIWIAACALMESVLNADYGMSGLTAILAMYLLRRLPAAGVAVGCTALVVLNLSVMQVFGYLTLIPIALYSGKKGPSAKAFYYLFYPAHLLLLVLLRVLLNI
ncbi:MAG: hypothetical protein IJ313_09695 [Clostridia bacterium]|nr:hypothetical protein [Clostridia bacterium]